MSGSHLSKEFFELLKAIGESKSKQEEDRIITREVSTLKKKLETPQPTSKPIPGIPGHLKSPLDRGLSNKKRAKEFLVRLLYVEMLGHDGSFGYIKAVELAASTLITHKRVGYLVCGACLPPEHEFRFMLVNQMQRDLNSSNVLETCAALLAVTRIITGDMVPAISGDVGKLLMHGSEVVRKKAIMALHRFYEIAPEAIGRMDLIEKLRRVLCDRDPSVMGASLNVIEYMAQQDSTPFKDLIPSLISILKQICEHRLPSDYDYHRVPAPWIQMKIIRILAILGKKDATASNGIYEILGDTMKRADVGINAGYAIVYECVRTITIIYPNPTLLDAAADAISRFISSRSANLKYLGVNGLAAIVESHPQYAAAHQLAVIECLEDRDETLQRKTLDLLYRMTNPVNVEFITSKLLEFLRGTTDPFLKSSLTAKICSIAERYAPTNAWYINTITSLFEISGDLVKREIAQNLMSLIAEGTGTDDDDETADLNLRRNAVELYARLLDKPNLPQILTETMAWVLGEYAYLSQEHELTEILDKLCVLARKARSTAPASTLQFLTLAIMKLIAQAGTCSSQAAHIIDDFCKSKDFELQQRSLEFQNLLTSANQIMGEVMPIDASCEDLEVDENLYFLDDFVQAAVQRGCPLYNAPEEDSDDEEDLSKKEMGLRFEAYERPQAPSSLNYIGRQQDSVSGPNGVGGPAAGPSNAAPPPPPAPTQNLQLRTASHVWGKGGVSKAVVPEPTPAPAPAGVATAVAGTNPYAPAPKPATQNPYAPSSGRSANPYGPSGYQTTAIAEPVKTKEMIEKEKMAAALFGGISAGVSSAPVAPPSAPVPVAPPAPVPQQMAPVPVPVPAPAPVPVPAPAPEVDLLDFSFDSPAPAPAPMSASVDPFNLSSTPATSTIFTHNSQPLTPLVIPTQSFGQKWVSLPYTHTASHSTALSTAADFISVCEKAGLGKVEVITATNEGIAAGTLGQNVVLVHGKVGVGRVDVTVKSDEIAITQNFNSHLPGML